MAFLLALDQGTSSSRSIVFDEHGNIVALAESPKKEGRIYVGTDDGLIQITDDGGTTWRKVETFPGVPNNTYVSKIVASEHDANTVYASFDNHKNSDFKPYLLKSTDAGRTWATVAGNLPERGTVYCVCEDPVRSDLLFCGTEFALYVSADGGQKWQRMRGGLPTIQVKDLVIQKHNGDLVVGTFGRGFYVFDDYVALRSLTPDVLAKDAHVFAVKPTMQYVQSRPYGGGGKAFLGESLYTADNPPVGANLTYYLKSAPKSKRTLRKEAERRSGRENPPAYPSEADLRAEAEEESSAVIISITDASGAVVRTITAPATEGVSRVVWDYRENPPIAEVPTEDDGEDAPAGRRGGGGGRGGRGGGGRGPMVVPGTYRATLSLRSGGKVTPMAGPVDVIVLPDNLSKLNAADYNEIAAHNKRIRQLSVLLTATTGKLVEVSAKVDAMKAANDQAPKPDPAVRSKCNELQAMLREIRRDISGDNVLSARNINVPDSIASRVGLAASANAESITKPTGTQTDAAAWALKALTAHGEKLKALAEKDLPDLEKKLDAIGAPWTPGRIAK
jgi:hypothetical protein